MNLSHTWRFTGLFTVGLVVWILWKSLSIGHTAPMSPTIGQAFPEFRLTDVMHPKETVSLKDIKGKPAIIHFWATWCGICLKENSDWLAVEKKWHYPLVGIAYRDDARKVRQILKDKGNPYKYIVDDVAGKLGLELGITGTPETYIIDKNGIIRFHYTGAIDLEIFESEFLPVLKKLDRSGEE